MPTTTTLTARIRRELRKIEGMIESPGTYYTDEDAFWVNGKEVAHFHGDDAIELRLTKKKISAQRTRLKTDERVELPKSSSDWLIVRFGSPRDVALVIELAEIAAAAHRAPPGTTPKAHQPEPTSNAAAAFTRLKLCRSPNSSSTSAATAPRLKP